MFSVNVETLVVVVWGCSVVWVVLGSIHHCLQQLQGLVACTGAG